jgi:hypothetical protein
MSLFGWVNAKRKSGSNHSGIQHRANAALLSESAAAAADSQFTIASVASSSGFQTAKHLEPIGFKHQNQPDFLLRISISVCDLQQ